MASLNVASLKLIFFNVLIVTSVQTLALLKSETPIDQSNSLFSTLHLQKTSGPEAMEFISKRGFSAELYTIPSRDGTPMTLYHLINPLADPSTLNRFPVLISHGLSGDAAQMLSHSDYVKPRRPLLNQVTFDETDTNLPFMLLNNNFDVYMMDLRGVNMNDHQAIEDFNLFRGNKFYNFSIDEQALLDLPTAIDFVLEQTFEPKLHFIGFSESTTFMFALLSTYPEYQDKLVSYVALAPVAYLSHAKGAAVSTLAALAFIPDSINFNYMGAPLADTIGAGIKKMCQFELLARTVCTGILDSFIGLGSNDVSHGFYSTILKGTSIKSAKQFVQFFLGNRFGMYDHGIDGNIRAYGRPTPPDYELSRIRLPRLILFRGDKDFLSDPLDQERLIRELGVKPYQDFSYPDFNHLDFIMSSRIIERVNLPAVRSMLDILNQFTIAQGLPFIRDQRKLLLLKRFKPNQVVGPSSTRQIIIRSNLVDNMINGALQTFGYNPTKKSLFNFDLIPIPFTNTLMKQPLKLLQDIKSSNLG